MEKTLKFFSKVGVILMALFGVRYLLSFIGVLIPLEWFLIMFFGMIGMYGIILMIIYLLYINFG